MKKLHSIAFYALVTPAITLGAGSVLAEQSADPQLGQEQNTQRGTSSDQDAMKSTTQTSQDEQGTRTGQSDMKTASDSRTTQDQSQGQSRDYIESVPANGMRVTNLTDAELKTTGDEEVGSVKDVIIDQDGQVVAVVVSVGGFLGMGEKDVAIGWDQIQKADSPDSDEQTLRVDLSRESLRSAPEYKQQE